MTIFALLRTRMYTYTGKITVIDRKLKTAEKSKSDKELFNRSNQREPFNCRSNGAKTNKRMNASTKNCNFSIDCRSNVVQQPFIFIDMSHCSTDTRAIGNDRSAFGQSKRIFRGRRFRLHEQRQNHKKGEDERTKLLAVTLMFVCSFIWS